ncbi:MAG: thioredoxin domain-containing protein [Patescibacteria group bacterium]
MVRLPYFITAAAVISLVFLAIAYLAWNSSRVSLLSNQTSTAINSTQTTLSKYDDPLITLVPKGDRSSNQKTSVFVSSSDPVLGSRDAKVYVILYGSLLDDTIHGYLQNIKELQESYGGDVAIVWKDNAISEADKTAAMVGHCANNYGMFWKYAAAVTAESDPKQVAQEQGVNEVELQDCLDTSGVSGQVQQSTGLASPLGATNSHTLFVNDVIYTEPISLENLKKNIDETLATF